MFWYESEKRLVLVVQALPLISKLLDLRCNGADIPNVIQSPPLGSSFWKGSNVGIQQMDVSELSTW
jgi:hypothetical protein